MESGISAALRLLYLMFHSLLLPTERLKDHPSILNLESANLIIGNVILILNLTFLVDLQRRATIHGSIKLAACHAVHSE
jgi:hypothetical protein